MEYIAIGAGAFAGLIIAYRLNGLISILYYHRNIRKPADYLSFYNQLDQEVNFKAYKKHDKKIKTYADFLKLHQKAKDSVEIIYLGTLKSIAKQISITYVILLVVPAIAFFSYWYYFLMAALVTQIALLIHSRYVKNERIDVYFNSVLASILNEYSKTAKD